MKETQEANLIPTVEVDDTTETPDNQEDLELKKEVCRKRFNELKERLLKGVLLETQENINHLEDDELEVVEMFLKLEDVMACRTALDKLHTSEKDVKKLDRVLLRLLLSGSKKAAEVCIDVYCICTSKYVTPSNPKEKEKHYISVAKDFLHPYYQKVQENQGYDRFVEFSGNYLINFLQSLASRHYEHYIIRKRVLGRIKYNEFQHLVEIDETPYNADDLYREFTIGKFPCDVRGKRKDVTELIADVAKSYPYHPVRDYLKSCYETHSYTGTHEGLLKVFRQNEDDKLSLKYLEVFGTGAVHRIMKPGCKMRYVLIIIGNQNIGKSLIFSELANGWFIDDFNDVSAKDDIAKLHKNWIIELSEAEKIFRGAGRAAMKACMSRNKDSFRKPYGIANQDYLRPSVFVGTSNETQIFDDPTGNTRFMVIKVEGIERLDAKWVIENRDKIWADFYHLAMVENMLPMLTEEEESLQTESNKEFEYQDGWEEPIRKYLNSKGTNVETFGVSLDDIFSQGLSKGTNYEKRDEHRVSDILKKFGYERKKRRWSKGEPPSWRWTPTTPITPAPKPEILPEVEQIIRSMPNNRSVEIGYAQNN